MEKEKKDLSSAQNQTEFWRQRGATFNTLYQQLNLPQVKRIIQILENNPNKPESGPLDDYLKQY